MAARTKKATTDTPVHVALLDGFEVKSRPNGTVHTVKVEGKVVAEVCVGTRATRLNLRNAVKPPKGVELVGKSRSWQGGGLVVTPENLSAARALLTAASKAA